MAITPNGSPSWVRSNDHTAYGGNVNLKNYNDVGIVNPKTDVGAEHLARIAADMAAVARMADFAQLHITMASGSDAPTVNSCRLQTGLYTSSYAGTSPPTGFPTVVGISDGVVRIRFSTSYSDAYSVSGTFSPTFAGASIAEYGISSNTRHTWATASGSDVFVYAETSTGSGDPGNSVSVWVA